MYYVSSSDQHRILASVGSLGKPLVLHLGVCGVPPWEGPWVPLGFLLAPFGCLGGSIWVPLGLFVCVSVFVGWCVCLFVGLRVFVCVIVYLRYRHGGGKAKGITNK